MSENRSIKSTKNIISGFVQKTFALVLTFVSRTVFIKFLGVEMLGISGLFVSIHSVLCLADLGFSTAMTYSYYKPVAENDYKKISALTHFYKKVYLTIAFAITVIGLAIVPFLESIVNLEKPVDHLHLYYLIGLMTTVVSYLFVYKTTILTAYQQQYVIAKYNMIVNFVQTIVQIVIMVTTKNYILYLLSATFFTVFNNVYISHVVDKRFPFVKQKEILQKSDQKDIFSNLGSVFLYKVSSVLINSTDNIIISKMIGTVYVGYYSNYLTIINMISSYVTIAFSSLTASIGNLMIKDSKEKQYEVFKEVQVVSSWFSIVLASCVYVLLNDFINIWLGKGFLLDNLTVIAIGINFFLICLLNPIWIFREAAGIYRKTKYIMVICAVLNIGISILLGKYLGLSGVLFASAISKLLTYIWYEPIILFKNFFGKSPLKFFAPAIGITVITVGISAFMSYFMTFVAIEGVLGFIVKGIICFLISNVVFVIVFARNKYFKSTVQRIINIVKGFIKR